MVAEPAASPNAVREKIELARRELLDLGLRNSLINYRTLKARGVEVVGESPAEAYRALVVDGKRMSFAPAPDAPPDGGDLPQPEEPSPEERQSRQRDSTLQTAVSSEELQKRLLNTFYAARTFVEEQGVNTLYLALGMLRWYETPASDAPRRAPLLLVPVDLTRSNARDRFHIAWSGDDIGDNLSLAAKLKTEFRLDAPPLPEAEDLDLAAWFAAWQGAVAPEKRWSVDADAIALGFFSFGKFLMYHDLDVSTWPDGSGLADHAIVRPLLTADGFREPASEIADDAFIDPYLPVSDARQVMDADSTQTLAILDVNAGRNLVIQGPPGTGKSQTITNVIAEAIGAGKTVLFVAEKLAALEVVKRRLDSIGLGDACLELHSNKMNKRVVLGELARTLELGKPRVATDVDSQLGILADQRKRLNDYARAVNDPIGASGVTPYHAYGELLQLRRRRGDEEWPRLTLPVMADWDEAGAARNEQTAAELQARVAAMGTPARHPFWGSRKAVVLPSDRHQLSTGVPRAQAALAVLRAAQQSLAGALRMLAPETGADGAGQLAAARRVLDAPDVSGIAVAAPGWAASRAGVDALVAAGREYAEIRGRRDAELIPEAWDADVLDARQTLNAWRDRWWRFLSGGYRGAKSTLARLTRKGLPGGIDAQVALADDILAARRLAEAIDQQAALGAELFPGRWQGSRSDWAQLAPVAEWVAALHADEAAGTVPAGTVAYLAQPGDAASLRAAADAVAQRRAAWDAEMGALTALVDFDASRRFGDGATLDAQPLDAVDAMLGGWLERSADIDQMAGFNVSAGACEAAGIGEVSSAAAAWGGAGTRLVDAFRAGRFAVLLEQALKERPALAQFDAPAHELAVARFGELDQLTFQYNRARLALRHWDRLPRHEAGGQLGILRREFAKKTRHMPVRQLMRGPATPPGIQAGLHDDPLSIPTYIPPGALSFDLVIFDEASQVKPVDAFGALVRGRQAVVVGDSKQLPPTSFFDTLVDPEEVDEDDLAADIESVLELFSGQGAPQRMLRWHYRSRHESLIAVSNQEFYDNKLVVFPSPDAAREGAGLVYHRLEGTVYDRGSSRTNRDEARAVAEAVIRHAKASPDLTLGVAAFSIAQTDAIIDELERLRRDDPSAEPFFSVHPFEPFFVKNLENVQGDERDVIFISVGYGRTADGTVAMNFGPLNAEGGERRLNVLITRAKLRCEVFTNLSSEDIDLSRTTAQGVRAFKHFLKFAETGALDARGRTPGESGAAFDAVVREALEAAGYAVEQQVGSSGFFIDLAVVDPARPGRYLLAVLCDGPNYAAARSARDRDRSRSAVLERLGWHVHQLWSTDWFRNPERELAALVTAIEAAKDGAGDGDAAPAVRLGPVTREEPAEAAPPAAPAPSAPAYVVATPKASLRGRELHEVDAARLAGWLEDVVEVESPVHVEVAMRRVADAAGVGRVGNRIWSALDSAIAYGVRSGMIRRQGDFLWSPEMTTPPLRDRGGLSSRDRGVETIAPEELRLAVTTAVSGSYGMQPADIVTSAAALLGFSRVGDDLRAALEALVGAMTDDGALRRQGEHLVAATEG